MHRLLKRYSSVSDAIKKKIMDDLKESLKSSNKSTSTVLRSVLSEVTYAQKLKTSTVSLVSIIEKAVKQRNDAAKQYQTAGRADLADNELNEIKILSKYLPEKITMEQLKSLVQKAIESSNAKSQKDLGKVLKTLQESVPEGSASKADMANVTKELLSKINL